MGQKTPPPAPEKTDEREPATPGLPSKQDLDRELDEELDQTFPASDPLPTNHRVD